MTEPEEQPKGKIKAKTIGGIAGVTAFLGAIAGVITAVHGSHSTNTAITRNDTPIVINRPTDAAGSPKPVTVIDRKDGPPIVIVGHGAPMPCPTVSPTPTPSPTVKPSPTPTPSPTC